jgi:hypothetical protein
VSWTKVTLILAAAITGLYGAGFFLISIRRANRYRNWRDILYRDPSRVGELLVGTSLILTGLVFAGFSTFWSDLLTSFVLATGVQMVLSFAGIRLELFSNNPTQ